MSDASPHEDLLLEKRRRQALVVLSSLAVFFFTGPVLGWGPMQLLLEENGAYSSKCYEEDQEDGLPCSAQTARLVKIGMSISMTQITAPFTGAFIDKFGPKLSAYLQAFLAISGLSLIVVAAAADIDILLNIGFLLLSTHTWLGTSMIVQLGLYFQGHTRSRIIFISNTLFGVGTIVYLGLLGIGQASGISAPTVLSGYLVLGCVLYGTWSYFWTVAIPETDDKKTNAASINSPTAGSKSDPVEASAQGMAESDKVQSPACESTHELDLPGSDHEEVDLQGSDHEEVAPSTRQKQKIASLPFVLLCIFYGLQVGSCNWNFATQRAFLAGLGDDERDNLYLTTFTLMNFLNLLTNPFIDWVLLRYGWIVGLQVVNALAICYQVVKVSSTNLNVQILGFFLFPFYRSFHFGVSWAFLPWLMDGPSVGRASGIMIGSAGICNLLLIPIVDIAVNQEGGDFQTANLVMLGLVIPSILLVYWLTPYVTPYVPKENLR